MCKGINNDEFRLFSGLFCENELFFLYELEFIIIWSGFIFKGVKFLIF